MIQYNIAAISPRAPKASIDEIDLQKACRLGDLDAIKRAFKLHPDKLNEKDEALGWTPLYRTVICGHLKGAEYLLKHKADPNIINNLGEAPLHQAADNSQYALAEILLKYGANANLQQNDGDTSLHHAAYRGDSKMVSILLNNKADPNIPNHMFGRTPLHYAADCGHMESISLMVKAGGDLDLKDLHGKSPFELANKEVQDYMKFLQEEMLRESSHPIVTEKPINLNRTENFEPESEISVIKKKAEITPLYNWLEKNGLLEIYDVLCENGFEDLNNIIEQMHSSIPIKKEDLSRIGIKKAGLINKFLMKMEEEAGIMPYSPASAKTIKNSSETQPKISVSEWLESMKLSELKDIFIESGFDDYNTILSLMHSRYPITDQLLVDIGVIKLGHRNRILSKLQEETTLKEKRESLIMEKTTNTASCQRCLIM
ncbi:unnamed protein product [Blepharisma stoltei]|uniref:SAM domain-containing protein n=1 Tax=Blepharisma stoltei TaxID=1481888 RepID=A0AAU9IFL8_9CILI|nr:unnamed protein product [Blepharisma stoltei]